MLGSGPTAAARPVQEPALREVAEELAGLRRLLVVAAEGVGQARVRVADDVHRRDSREVVDVRPHLSGTQRAVHAGGERLGVLDRRPEGLDGLSREVAPAPVDDRHRDEERHVRCHLLDRRDRGFAVERVEDRLNKKDVGAARYQPARRLGIPAAQLVEGDVAIRGIVDLGR